MIVRQEPLAWLMRDGLEGIARQQWTESSQPGEFGVVWINLLEAERDCRFQVVAARAGAKLVGYNSFWIDTTYRSGQIRIARNDVMYLLPEYRRGWNGVRLVREGERIAREAGAKRISYGLETWYREGAVCKLLSRMGYAKTGELYSRAL